MCLWLSLGTHNPWLRKNCGLGKSQARLAGRAKQLKPFFHDQSAFLALNVHKRVTRMWKLFQGLPWPGTVQKCFLFCLVNVIYSTNVNQTQSSELYLTTRFCSNAQKKCGHRPWGCTIRRVKETPVKMQLSEGRVFSPWEIWQRLDYLFLKCKH